MTSSSPRQIERLCVLVHPLCYEPHAGEPDFVAKYADYLDYEGIVKQRWLDRISDMGDGDALVICGNAPNVLEHARSVIGDRVFVVTDTVTHQPELWDTLLSDEAKAGLGHDLLAMHWRNGFGWDSNTVGQPIIARGWAERIRRTFEERGLAFDPATLQAEGWGESFEGCVANYTRYLGTYLGLTDPIDVRFDLCVPDARFLFDAELQGVVSMDRAVRCYLWTTGEAQIAWFHRAFAEIGDPKLTAWIAVDDMRIEVRDNRQLLWPGRDSAVEMRDGELGIPVGDRCYVCARNAGPDEFRAAMSCATVTEKGRVE